VLQMGKVRLGAILPTLLGLGACHVYPYRYVEFSGENIVVAATGEPSLSAVRHGGAPIPIGYALVDADVSLTLWIGNDPNIPSLDIVSSVPIRDVVFGTTRALASGPRSRPFCRTEGSCKISLQIDKPGLPEVGEAVRLIIQLEYRVAPITISGAIAESGRYYENELYL